MDVNATPAAGRSESFRFHVAGALDDVTRMRRDGVSLGIPGLDPGMTKGQVDHVKGLVDRDMGLAVGLFFDPDRGPKLNKGNFRLVGRGAMLSARLGARALDRAAQASEPHRPFLFDFPDVNRVNKHLDNAAGHLRRALLLSR